MAILTLIKKVTAKCLHRLRRMFIGPDVKTLLEHQLEISGCIASAMYRDRLLSHLADAEFKVYSQHGEDGIIEWLVHNLPEGDTRFIELGVGSYHEANTRFLLKHRNWKGMIVDCEDMLMKALRREELYWMHDLTAVSTFITRDNINSIFLEHGFEGEIGLLSIDLDGNDYWVLKAIEAVKPRILICEINPLLGDVHPLTVPYDPQHTRFKKHYCGQYYGASVEAMRQCSKAKGYTFLGTDLSGINAFFVRDDLFSQIAGKIKEIKVHPSRHRDSRDEEGRLSFTSGNDRIKPLLNLSFVNTVSGQTVVLGECGRLFSDERVAM